MDYKAGTFLRVILEAGFCGCDDEFFIKLNRTYSEKELHSILDRMAYDNAAMYDIFPEEDATEEELENYEEGSTYSSDIGFYVEEVTEEDCFYDDIEEWN